MERHPPVYCCHCFDCQKWSGSAFAEQAVISENAITAEGPIIRVEVVSRQGRRSTQYLCGACHTRIFSTSPERPGIALLRAGTLEDTADLRPGLHMWVKSKQPWVNLPDSVPAFAEAPPLDQLRALLRPGENG